MRVALLPHEEVRHPRRPLVHRGAPHGPYRAVHAGAHRVKDRRLEDVLDRERARVVVEVQIRVLLAQDGEHAVYLAALQPRYVGEVAAPEHEHGQVRELNLRGELLVQDVGEKRPPLLRRRPRQSGNARAGEAVVRQDGGLFGALVFVEQQVFHAELHDRYLKRAGVVARRQGGDHRLPPAGKRDLKRGGKALAPFELKVRQVVEHEQAGARGGREQVVGKVALIEIAQKAGVARGDPEDVLQAEDVLGVPERGAAFAIARRRRKVADRPAILHHLGHEAVAREAAGRVHAGRPAAFARA